MKARVSIAGLVFVLLACGEAETCRIEEASGKSRLVCPDGSSMDLPGDSGSCTVEQTDDDQTVVRCDDGSEVVIPPGKPGRDGVDGRDGADGKDGRDGTDGMDGRPGRDGKDGVDGKDGKDGEDGEDGLDSLLHVEEEAPGEACPAGGWRIFAGHDLDRDGQLDVPDEVVNEMVVCHGQDGADGKDGEDGKDGKDGTPGGSGPASLVRVDELAPKASCPYGGMLVHVGFDVDEDGVLDDDEIVQSQPICNPKPFVVGWELLGIRTLRAGEREAVGFRAVVAGALDPFRTLSWRVQLVDEQGNPVVGTEIFYDDGTHLPPDDGGGAGGDAGAGGAGGSGGAEGGSGGDGVGGANGTADGDGEGGEGGAGGSDVAAIVGPPDHREWLGRLVTDTSGRVILEPSHFTAADSGLLASPGVEIWLSLVAPPQGSYELRFELVDANTLEVLDERWSGVFDTLSPGDRFFFVGLDGLLPEKKGVIGVVPLLGADVDPAEPVRLRLRFEEKVGGSFAPLAPRTFYDLHGVDLADPTAWESQPVVTASDGTVWMGPASMPAAQLQDLVPEMFLAWGALPAGEIRVTAEVVSLVSNAVLSSDQAEAVLVHTTSDLTASVANVAPGGRGLVELGIRLSTALDPEDEVRLRLVVESNGAPVPGVTFYYDPAGGDPSLHHTWTDSFQTSSTGSALHPQIFEADEFRVEGYRFLHLSLQGPASGRYSLEVRVEREADGSLLASYQVSFQVP
mgnify:CR=1 FL=1